MKLKTKLSLGLGFLFAIIFTIVIFCMFYIGKISMDSENILKDNYNSVMYAKNMLIALDDMNSGLTNQFLNNKENIKPEKNNPQILESAKKIFEQNLSLEKNNITENNEKEYVENLNMNYEKFIRRTKINNNSNNNDNFTELALYYQNTRNFIERISDINMQAIIRKNQFAKKDAENTKMIIAFVGAICFLLAFGYFWYFPFYVSNTISYLSDKMIELLEKAGIKHDLKTNDESFIILNSIELLKNKFQL